MGNDAWSIEDILGYVLAIAMLLILATIGVMSLVSTNIVIAATTMAATLILVGLLAGIGYVTTQSKKVSD